MTTPHRQIRNQHTPPPPPRRQRPFRKTSLLPSTFGNLPIWQGSYPRTSTELLPIQTSREAEGVSGFTGMYIRLSSEDIAVESVAEEGNGKAMLHSPSHGDVVAIDWADRANLGPRLVYEAQANDKRTGMDRGKVAEMGETGQEKRVGMYEVTEVKMSKMRRRSSSVLSLVVDSLSAVNLGRKDEGSEQSLRG